VLFTIGMQAVINLAVVTVVVPTKGIALPFVSMGGTGWVFTGFALGLVASLDNAAAIKAARAAESPTEDGGVGDNEVRTPQARLRVA